MTQTPTPEITYRAGEAEGSFPQVSAPVLVRPFSEGVVRPKVASEGALEVLHKEPIKTVWGWNGGRVIYDRLPEVTGTYKQSYTNPDLQRYNDQTFVYLQQPFQNGIGPGSLECGVKETDFSLFQVYGGQITWSAGTVTVPTLEVDVTQLNDGNGLQDGAYQAGYLLSETVPSSPTYTVARVEDSLIGEAKIAVAASSEWIEHPASYAISDVPMTGAWWPYDFSIAGDYTKASWYVLDFTYAVAPEKFELIGDSTTPPNSYASLYWSDNAIVWYKDQQTSAAEGTYTFLPSSGAHDYWKFFFWGRSPRGNVPLKASISELRYTGDALWPNYTSLTPSPFAEPYIDDLYETIPQEHIQLCSFSVKDGKIYDIADNRRFIYRKFEPVASWLTNFQDTMLRCYFDDIVNYSRDFMAPPTADYKYYEELDDSLCNGRGFLTVGDIESSLTIDFPSRVLETLGGNSSVEVFNAKLKSDPIPGVNLDIDGATDSQLQSDGSNLIQRGGIFPQQIWELRDPTNPGDCANRAYVDFQLNLSWSIDNGFY